MDLTRQDYDVVIQPRMKRITWKVCEKSLFSLDLSEKERYNVTKYRLR